MRQKSASKGAHLYLENSQGLALPELLSPERYQQLMAEWFTNKTLLVSLSRQVQITLSSQYSPYVWKSSAKVVPFIVYSPRVLQNWLVVQSAPQCKVEPKVYGPPPDSLGYPTLPLLSIMSISPLVGQPPYQKSRGMSQIAGQSQSPLGSLALTYTLPKVKEKEFTVVSLPLITGLIQLTPFDSFLQPLSKLAVQKSPGDPPQRSQQELFLTALAPIFSSRGTGCINSIELLVQVVVRLFSYTWNSWLPPPARVRSCLHFLKSSFQKSSQKTNLVRHWCMTKSDISVCNISQLIQQNNNKRSLSLFNPSS